MFRPRSYIPSKLVYVNLGQKTTIGGVITQGRSSVTLQGGHWVKEFKLQQSIDGTSFHAIKDPTTGLDKIFPGNNDGSSPVTNLLEVPIFAQYVRVWPQKWHYTISMRIEVLGCPNEMTCPVGTFRCGRGTCIQSWKHCDGVVDCFDGKDEEECECYTIPDNFALDGRLTMLPNLLDHATFGDVQNSPTLDLLNSSYADPEIYHSELREFVSTILFPRCNVSDQNCPLLLNPNSPLATSCAGSKLLPCLSWCKEVMNTLGDHIKSLLPACESFASLQNNCWNPEFSMRNGEVCYHGIGMNYRGTWSKTTSGLDCRAWSTAQAGYYRTEYPWANLDDNYCRNPTGLQRPFCVTDGEIQEECDVIPCSKLYSFGRRHGQNA
ncbi:uncharacterized protein [Branchiostoma lanceolatum]|uniref:uncharacterized protein n=1 Tax=Branchiostoma lanceolatum TaxID=7740 RepID=UPI0034522D48